MYRLFFFIIFLINPLHGFALPDDENQPIHISADRAEFNEKQGTAVYSGNVIMEQGSIRVNAEKVTIYQGEKNALHRIVAEGSPAKYQQKPAQDKAVVHASSRVIDYEVKSRRIVLTKQAKLEQEGNTFQGDKIVYDLNKKIVNATATDSGRVNMVLQPKKKPE